MSRARGFTLAEVLVALVVLALGVLSVASLIPAGTRSATSSGQTSRASQLACSTMERLLAEPWAEPSLAPGNHVHEESPSQGKYWITWVVEDNQPVVNCRRITVTVRWPEATSPRSVRLVGIANRAGAE